MSFCSPLEVGSRLTSGFGQRWGVLHAGTDYGAPTPGTKRRPVYAVASGTILRTGRGNGTASAVVVPYHSGLAIWQDLGWIGGDRMRAYYGHLDEYLVKPGQSVRFGELIGYTGGSGANGANDFAPHLHFGIAQNHDRPTRAATALGEPGWINPHIWLLGKGITVGTTPPVDGVVIVPAGSTNAGKVEAPEVGQTNSKHVRSEASIRAICIKAGHGDSRTSTGLLIERYQHRQFDPFQLPWDRQWGPRTENHYRWTLKLQAALNRWKGTKISVDGDYRGATVSRVREWQERNRNGVYKGYRIDGVPGPVVCRLLGIPSHP